MTTMMMLLLSNNNNIGPKHLQSTQRQES